MVQNAKFMYSNNVTAILKCRGFSLGGDAQEPKSHRALRSVSFLASFITISFYFEILSYLTGGEKII